LVPYSARGSGERSSHTVSKSTKASDSLSLAQEKMLDASYESGAEQAVPEKLLCEGRGEGGAEEGAAAPSAA